jgi:hypothetical protein
MSASANPRTTARHLGDCSQGGEQRCDQKQQRSGNRRKTGPLTVRGLNALIGEFEAALAHATPAAKLFEQHRRLLQAFEGVHTVWERRQVSVAEDFNILRTMRLSRKELCHSNILAWLLDHSLNAYGTHAQGSRGFRLFLQRVGLPPSLAAANYRVDREVSVKYARLDIRIEPAGQFVIGIENKVGAKEMMGLEDGEDQTRREWDDLKRRGKELRVPSKCIRAFFLTPDNEPPQSRNFTAISWRLVADVFEEFAAKAKPPMVRLFAQHYAETLRRDVVVETETQDEENE